MTTAEIGSASAALETESAKVLEAYNRRGHIFDAFGMFRSLFHDLNTPGLLARMAKCRINVERTMRAFGEDDTHGYVMSHLAMSMPPMAIRAVCSGSVARLAYQTQSDQWYDARGPGVYAVGIGVDGRGGRFLNGQEIRELAQHVMRYAEGCEALALPVMERTRLDASKVRFVRAVDGAISPFSPPDERTSRAVRGRAELERVYMLAERLGARAKAALRLDPTGTTLQDQSPLYIGCSSKLENRTQVYTRMNLPNMNKLLVLTLNILRDMGLPSKAIVRPVIRIWKADQLPVAERLVTTLAGSLVAQHGFNATEAGGEQCSASRNSLREGVNHVFGIRGALKAHVEQVNAELEKQEKFVRDLAELASRQERLADHLKRLEAQIDEIFESRPMTLSQFYREEAGRYYRWQERRPQIERVQSDLYSLLNVLKIMSEA